MLCCHPVSVCPSVTSQFYQTAKPEAQNQHYMIAQALCFLMPKISATFQWGHPQRGRQVQVEQFN